MDVEFTPEDFTGSNGYNDYNGDNSIPWGYTPGGIIRKGNVTSVYPNVSGISVGSGISISQYKLAIRKDKGWNAWARSVSPLESGKFFECTIPFGVEAAFFGLDRMGRDGQSIGSFKHGVMIDTEGITVRENDQLKRTLKSSFSDSSKIKLFRDETGVVSYVVTTGTETVFYKSLAGLEDHPRFPLYIYGFLYSGGDRLQTNEYKTGRVQYAGV